MASGSPEWCAGMRLRYAIAHFPSAIRSLERCERNHEMANENLSVDPGASAALRTSPIVLSARTLASDDVYNLKGEKLGSIKEIMLDIKTGRVSYAVLSFGGFLSLGEKLFAVPWGALKVDTEKRRILFDVDEARLKTAPGFDKDQWPNMADPSWAKSIHTYYGTEWDMRSPE